MMEQGMLLWGCKTTLMVSPLTPLLPTIITRIPTNTDSCWAMYCTVLEKVAKEN